MFLNGICYGKRCEILFLIFIGGKKGVMIFNVVSVGDIFVFYYIVLEYIRYKR